MNHISLEYLHQLSGNDREFEKEILSQFLQQTRKNYRNLKIKFHKRILTR